MKLISRCGALALLLGVTASAQTPVNAGFAPLFDGKSLNNWVVDDKEYVGNFSVRDGHLRIEGQGGWLRSNREYRRLHSASRFPLSHRRPGRRSDRRQRRVSSHAGQSTYESGWPDNSLEVQLANRQGGRPAIPGDARWGGAVLRHGNPGGPTSFDTRLRPAILWSHRRVADLGNSGDWRCHSCDVERQLPGHGLGRGNARGYIGLQAETGGIEFRSVEINEGVKGLVAGRSSDGFVPLFDGKTLTGWKPENASSPGFDVVDGALVVRGRPSGPPAGGTPTAPTCSGNIWTEKSYGDFVVRYQARFQTNGSVGGFFLRSHPPGSQRGGIQGGWNQVETRAMQDKLLPWNGILMRSAGGDQGDTVFDYRAANLAYAAINDWTRDWVDYEVRAQGSRISIWVNGFLLSKADDVLPLEGVFGLQCDERPSIPQYADPGDASTR